MRYALPSLLLLSGLALLSACGGVPSLAGGEDGDAPAKVMTPQEARTRGLEVAAGCGRDGRLREVRGDEEAPHGKHS